MALSETQKQNVYKAKFDGTSSFVPDLTKIPAQTEPTLVIGLGGTGIDALLRVKKKVMDTFQTGDANRQVPENFVFYGLDTDKSSFEPPLRDDGTRGEQRNYMGVKLEQGEWRDLSVRDIGAKLAAKHTLPAFETEWLDPDLQFLKDPGAGAGGIRQISRFSLFCHADEVVQDIKNMLTPLSAHHGTNQDKIRIYLLTGIAGGTGSGTFLDVAYLLQEAVCRIYPGTKFATNAASMAYIFTPDVNMTKFQDSYIQTNGYAALKELDYLMNLEKNNDTFHQKYSLGVEVSPTNEPPFGQVHLLSARFVDGGLVEDAYERTMQIAAEHIISFMSADNNAVGADTSMLTPRGYEVNVPRLISTMTETLERGNCRETVGYSYTILGCDCKVLPVKDIMLCLGKMLFNEVTDMATNGKIEDKQLEAAMSAKHTNLNLAGLDRDITQGVDDFATLKKNPNLSIDIVMGKNWVPTTVSVFEKLLTKNVEAVKKNAGEAKRKEKEEKIRAALGRFFTNEAAVILSDPAIPAAERREFGPAWANNLTLHMRDAIKVKYDALGDTLTNIQKQLWDEKDVLIALENKRKSAVNGFRPWPRKDAYEDYMNGFAQLYAMKLDAKRIEAERDFLEEIAGYLADMNHTIFETVEEVLKAFASVFDDGMVIAGDIEKRRNAEGSVVLSWNLLDITQVNGQIMQMLQDNGVNMTVVANKLYAHIWKNLGKWTEDSNEFSACESLRDFIAGEFQTLLNRSIEYYLKQEYEALGQNKPATFQDWLKDVLGEKMKANSNMVFNAGLAYGGLAGLIPQNHRVLIPEGCGDILAAFQGKFGNAAATNVGMTKLTTKINWLSSAHGVPLYTYGEIRTMEDEYEDMVTTDSVDGPKGYHLYMVPSSGRDWRQLPALVPASQFENKKPVRSEFERRQHYGEVFDQAVQYGVIRKNADDKYECVFAGTFDAQTAFDGCKTESGYDYEALEALLDKLENYLKPETTLPYLDPHMEQNKTVTLVGGKNLATVKNWYMICYGLNLRVEKEVAKYKALEDKKTEVEKIIGQLGKLEQMIRQFAIIRMLNWIQSAGTKYQVSYQGETWDLTTILEISSRKLGNYKEYALFDMLFRQRDKTEVPDPAFEEMILTAEDEFNNLGDAVYNAVNEYYTLMEPQYRSIRLNCQKVSNGKDAKVFYDVLKEFMDGLK